MTDKRALRDVMIGKGIDTPASTNTDGAEAFANERGYPLVVKPTRGTGGSRGVMLVADERELKHVLENARRDGREVLVQEYVGTAEDEYTVGVVSDVDGKVADSIVMRRKLMGLSLMDSRRTSGGRASVSTG